MLWSFCETSPISGSIGSWGSALQMTADIFDANRWLCGSKGTAVLADATSSPLPDQSADVWFVDPPYYDAIPYADLADFFLVWLRRMLPADHVLFQRGGSVPDLKNNEIVQDTSKTVGGLPKDRTFFETRMAQAFAEGRRIMTPDGIGCVVFAHKTTEGWEALLSGMIRGGFVITASWPIATERPARLRSIASAALATSVHLVCRPRLDSEIGDWGDIHAELPARVGDWMERLQSEDVRGADLVFACIGPALEIYSRYAKVVDASDREIPLGGNPEATEPHKRGYLAYVWEAVGRAALAQVLGTAEAEARNGAARAVEEDARLTALFLWTLQSTNGARAKEQTLNGEEDEESSDEEEVTPAKRAGGLTLIYDVVRRFAQPLGIHLQEWEDRIIETDKGVVRLLPVAERAEQLFGEEGAGAMADYLESNPSPTPQLPLFPDGAGAVPKLKRRHRHGVGPNRPDAALEAHREATTLDRVHAAMLLQRAGRANALRAMLSVEQDRGPDFLRLANALSALYPKESEEKRLLDAMLLGIPRR
jgi:adenine-specific DNA methylase